MRLKKFIFIAVLVGVLLVGFAQRCRANDFGRDFGIAQGAAFAGVEALTDELGLNRGVYGWWLKSSVLWVTYLAQCAGGHLFTDCIERPIVNEWASTTATVLILGRYAYKKYLSGEKKNFSRSNDKLLLGKRCKVH